MFSGFTEESGTFFWDLMFNNERPWFQEHKDQFDRLLNAPFKELGRDTFDIVSGVYPDMNLDLHLSRIYRDARRLFGRGPYKDNLWFTLENRSTKGGPAFFFEIRPSSWSYGMGVWYEKTADMETIRQKISANPAGFERLAVKAANMKEFIMEGEKYKRPKADLGPVINEWYNRKYISIVKNCDFGGELFDSGLPKILAAAFIELMPVYQFLES